jgi:hypothetical protein
MAGQQRLGSLLVELGFIDDGQLESALEEQQRTGKRLGKILVDASVITEDRLVHALSRQLGIEVCDPLMTHIHQRVLDLIPVEVAHQYRVLPMAMRREDTGDILFVATSDPLNKNALSAIRSVAGGRRVRWLIAGETEMELALARHYGSTQQKLRPGQPTPMPHGLPVITGTPISAPKGRSSGAGTGTLDVPHPAQVRTSDVRPAAEPPRVEPSNGGIVAADLVVGEELPELEVARPIDAPPIWPAAQALATEELPPIDVPPEFLTNAEAGLMALESDLPAVSASLAVETVREPVRETVEEARKTNGNAKPGGSLLPTPGMSWGDMVGGLSEAVLSTPPIASSPPEEAFPPPDMPELEPLPLDPIEALEIDTMEIDAPMHALAAERPTDEQAEGAQRAERAKAHGRSEAQASWPETEPLEVPITVDESAADPTDLGEPIEDVPEDLPDASDDILPASDPRSAVLEGTGDLNRPQKVRDSILRFVDEGVMEEDPVFVLRLLATILEGEGLLDEARISAALEIIDRPR